MELDNDDIFIVGYGGWVKVNVQPRGSYYENWRNEKDDKNILEFASRGKMFQVTSASVTRQTNLPIVNSYYLPYEHDGSAIEGSDDAVARSQILLGNGTYTFSGEISFELTNGAMDEFFASDFFERNTLFSVSFFDGQNTCVLSNCVWSNFQLQCSPSNLVSASISYQSNNGYVNGLKVFGMDVCPELAYDENDLLVPYWQCGHGEFQEFGIGFERSVTPVFLNGDIEVASYLRPGLITISLNATTVEYIEDWEEALDIRFGSTHGIRLLKSVLQSKQYNMSSMTDTGAKTYTWNSIAEDAGEQAFQIY